MNEKPIVIIGAGVAGLTAAMLLSKAGKKVIVVEKNPHLGGKMRELPSTLGGIDSGPTVFTMRPVFERIFEQCDHSLEQALPLQPLNILARHSWQQDEGLDLFADIDATVTAISTFANAQEGERYREFCDEARLTFQTLRDTFIYNTRPSPVGLVSRLGLSSFKDFTRINPFKSLWQALAKYFHDPRLQQLFGRYATYMGSSPYLAPATLMLIAHVEQEGVWIVEGGMYRLVEAMVNIAKSQGAEFRVNTNVTELKIQNKQCHQVILEDDECLDAEAVVFNGDVNALATGMLGQALSRHYKPTHQHRSLSAITWSMSTKVDNYALLRHTVFFSDDYQKEFKELFVDKRLPSSPTVYVCAQDRADNLDQQQLEQERIFCLVNAPAIGDNYTFTDNDIAVCQDAMLKKLQDCGMDVSFDPAQCIVTTPTEFNRLFPATGGALYGRASHGWQASFQRPGSKCGIKGLYLAGGSVHPGAGIPMAATSGRLAAECILDDQ